MLSPNFQQGGNVYLISDEAKKGIAEFCRMRDEPPAVLASLLSRQQDVYTQSASGLTPKLLR